MASNRRLWFTHKCRFCSYLFVCERDLVHHEATHDETNFACDRCLSVFEDAEELRVHVSDGGCCVVDESSTADVGQQHVCRACGEIFHFVRELYRHYGERHMDDGRKSDDGDGTSFCTSCGAMFSGTASLKVHLWKAHNINLVQQPANVREKNRCDGHRESYPASACNRLLARDEDKPFKCSMCNWSFKYDFSYRSHLKMHEEKQRSLEKMLSANAESSADCEVPVTDVSSSVLSGGADVTAAVMVSSVKRKWNSENGDDADDFSQPKARIVCSVNRSRDTVLSSDSASQPGCEPSGDLNSVDQPLRKSTSEGLPTTLCPEASGLLQPSRPDSDGGDDPFRFVCKLCRFKCRYDFTYVAHLNQHEKLRELEIDDLQSHLVATSTQTPPPDDAILNKFAAKVITANPGEAKSRDGGGADISGVSYILICPGTVGHCGLVAGSMPRKLDFQNGVVSDAAIDALNPNVVLVDGVGHDLDLVTADDDNRVDFSDGPEMQFLDPVGGETLCVVNEADLQVSLDAGSEPPQKFAVYEDADTEEVECLRATDGQLLDVADLCSDNDCQSDGSTSDAESFTCYYCAAVFTKKSSVEQHILQLHVD